MNPGQFIHPRHHPLAVAIGILLAALALVVAGPVPWARATGEKVWASHYDGPRSGYDHANAMAVSPDGTRVYVTGDSNGTGADTDFATVAYDAVGGAKIWVARYKGAAKLDDNPRAIAVSADGTMVFVTGQSRGKVTDYDFATVAYDAATGTQVWAERYDGPASAWDAPYAIGVSPDGTRVYVTGSRTGSLTRDEFATVAYDAATGQKIWVRGFTGYENGYAESRALGVSPDGTRVYVTGFSDDPTGVTAYVTIAYDAATGTEAWMQQYGARKYADSAASALAVSADGLRVYVSGSSGSSFDDSDYATVAYDAATGARVWAGRYAGPGDWRDIVTGLSVAPDGARVYVTGYSTGAGTGYDYATVAYDATTGTKAWVRRHDGWEHSWDRAEGIAVSHDGSTVYVTGESTYVGFFPEYDTFAYDAATGAVVWQRRFSPKHPSGYATAVEVSPDDGTVFVTGYSAAWGTLADYATVAYRAR